jgi:protein-S-isoprenylcysteine O-methyltransferase Ste14
MTPLPPWLAKAAVIAGALVMIAIRAPHGQRSRRVRTVTSGKGPLESALLAGAMAAFFVPLLWLATPWLAFADYPLHPAAFASGAACLALGLWIFHRSHADLGTNWSVTLEVRESHSLVTEGVYRRVRHPMYAGLLLYSLGQALVLPNGIAGPSYLVAMLVLFAFRVRAEERLMLDRFGGDYAAYMARTKRLVPGAW